MAESDRPAMHIRLPPVLRRRVESLAAEEGMSTAEFARNALRAYCNRVEGDIARRRSQSWTAEGEDGSAD